MNMLEIREFTCKDEEGIRKLFAKCFGKKMSHEEWIWKYKSSPWGSSAVIAVNDKEIVAHYGGIKMKFYFQDKIFDVFQPCDVMTHPQYRARIFSKRGVLVRTGEYFYKINSMDFAFGFPSERHAVLGTKQLGYTKHGYVNEISKIVEKSNIFISPLLRIYIGWDYIEDKEIDMLWDKNKPLFNLTIQKGSNYIFWRYKQKPDSDYVPVSIRTRFNGKIKSFFIALIREKEFKILDFFISNDFQIEDFIKVLEYFAIKHRLKIVKMWLNPEVNFYKVFTLKGFSSNDSIPYIFKILNAELTEEFLFKNYFYSMGDYDAS